MSGEATSPAGLLSRASIDRRGLREHAYDSILQMLLSGRLEPGARLTIDTIARQLDVSPTPVREAMVHLERTGLVTREALKGYRVAPPLASDQLDELFDARLMLETTAARLATPAGPDFLAELRAAAREHREAGERAIEGMTDSGFDVAATTAYFAADTAFHAVIFRHSGNHYVREMSESLGAQLHRMRQSVLHGVTDLREAIDEHQAIIEAFASDDPSAPEAAMRHHIEQVRGRSITDEYDAVGPDI